jgi:hypothetical protein
VAPSCEDIITYSREAANSQHCDLHAIHTGPATGSFAQVVNDFEGLS